MTVIEATDRLLDLLRASEASLAESATAAAGAANWLAVLPVDPEEEGKLGVMLELLIAALVVQILSWSACFGASDPGMPTQRQESGISEFVPAVLCWLLSNC